MFIFFCELVRDLSPRPTRLGGVGYKVVGGVSRGAVVAAVFGPKERFTDAYMCATYTIYAHTPPHPTIGEIHVKRDRENWFLCL